MQPEDGKREFVNAHAHTEWHGCGNLARGDGFVPWVRRVLALAPPADRSAAVAAAAAEMRAQGIALVGDYGAVDSAVAAGLFGGRHYVELLRDAAVPAGASAIAIHAVHTVARRTLDALTSRALFLSVHAGESAEEMMLYRDGSGSMAELLEERGFPREHAASLRGRSPIAILDERGLIGPRTQIVHAMHLGDKDLELIAERQAHVVLCPVSNRSTGTAFLRGDVSRARVERMIASEISMALGTDSTLSCDRLSMEENARVLEEIGIDRDAIAPMLRNRAAIGM